MRNGNIPVCLSLLFVVAVCTAAGISPLATQRAHIGPYHLLLSFYSLPRTEQLLNMTIQSTTPGMNLRFSQPVLIRLLALMQPTYMSRSVPTATHPMSTMSMSHRPFAVYGCST